MRPIYQELKQLPIENFKFLLLLNISRSVFKKIYLVLPAPPEQIFLSDAFPRLCSIK